MRTCQQFGCTVSEAVHDMGLTVTPRELGALTSATYDAMLADSCINAIEAHNKQHKDTPADKRPPALEGEVSEWFGEFLKITHSCRYCLCLPGKYHEDWCPIELGGIDG